MRFENKEEEMNWRTHGKYILPSWLGLDDGKAQHDSETYKHSGWQVAGNHSCREVKYTDAQSFELKRDSESSKS